MERIALLLLVAWVTAPAAEDQTWRALFTEVQRLRDLGDYAAARSVAQKALEEVKSLGPADARLGLTLSELGWLDHTLGRPEAAEKYYLRGIRILEQHPLHAFVLARALNDLASLYTGYGERYAQAEQLRRRTLAIATREYGPRHPEMATVLSNLATVRMLRGDPREARKLLENALDLLVNADSKYQSGQASVLGNLATLHFDAGDFGQALNCLLQAVPILERTLGHEHPELVVQLLNLGRVYLKLSRPALAGPPLRRAAAIAEAKLGTEHPYLVQIFSTLALVERKTGTRREADRLERQARVIEAAGQVDQAIGRARVNVSDLMDEQNRPERRRK